MSICPRNAREAGGTRGREGEKTNSFRTGLRRRTKVRQTITHGRPPRLLKFRRLRPYIKDILVWSESSAPFWGSLNTKSPAQKVRVRGPMTQPNPTEKSSEYLNEEGVRRGVCLRAKGTSKQEGDSRDLKGSFRAH